MTSETNCQSLPLEYELVDSGEGKKLERLGEYYLIRPCSLAVWKQRNKEAWKSAHAEYIPQDSWKLNAEIPETWPIKINKQTSLNINLQTNGQIGIFPEHYIYLPALSDFIELDFKVLNLFAYTGMASCFCARLGAQVTHVELSKKCLEWSKSNLELNKIDEKQVRFIKEDVLDFVSKEIKREKKYDLIILDPPSFSRISKNKTWDLEEILIQLISNLEKIASKHCKILFTFHLKQSFAEIISNLFIDQFHRDLEIKTATLAIKEANSDRKLPTSNLVEINLK